MIKYNCRSVLETVIEQTWAAGSKHNWAAEKTTNKNPEKQLEGEREKEKPEQCLGRLNVQVIHRYIQNSILTSYTYYICSVLYTEWNMPISSHQ